MMRLPIFGQRVMSVSRIVRGVAAVFAIAFACLSLGDLRATGSVDDIARAAQSKPAGASWNHPRTAWGDPDLEGVWTSDNNFAIPLERRPELADKEFLDGADLQAELAKRARLMSIGCGTK